MIKRLEEFASRGAAFASDESRGEGRYKIEAADFRLEAVVSPDAWLGVRLEVLDKLGCLLHEYCIDTDLYPIDQPEQRWFADAIENEIVDFLEDLLGGRLLRGSDRKGRSALIVPYGDRYRLCIRRTCFGLKYQTVREFSSLEQITPLADVDGFSPLLVCPTR